MSKRVYSSTIKKWAIGAGIAGIPLSILLIWYLISLGSIVVIGYSGDMVCAGTELNPCVAYINFTTKEDIFIYPNDTWKNTAFYTDPQPKDVRMYRSWGKGWREINLSQKCTGTWCGLKNSKDTSSFAFAFRTNQSYQIKYVVLKNSPEDTLKWGFTKEVDPKFLGITSENVFPKLIYNQANLTSGEAIFILDNPIENLSLSKYLNFDVLGDTKNIQNLEYFVLENVSKNESVYSSELVKKECSYKDNQSEGTYDCSYYNNVFKGYKINYYSNWVKKDVIPSGENTIKLIAHWKASTSGINVDWQPYIKFDKSTGVPNDITVRKSEWQWWNSSWGRKQAIKIQENLNSGIALTNYSVWINVTYDSDMNPDFSDLRFVNGSEDIELSYYIENKLDGNWSAIWVKIPYLVMGGNQTIYMYYKNGSAVTTTSSRNNAFLYFDSFDTDPKNTRWNCYDSTCGYNAGGWITVNAGSGFADALFGYFLESFSNVEYSATMSNDVSNYWAALSARGTVNSSAVPRKRTIFSVETNPDYMMDTVWLSNGSLVGVYQWPMPSNAYWTAARNVSTYWYNYSTTGTMSGVAGGNYTFEYNSPNIKLYNGTSEIYMDNSYIEVYGRSSSAVIFDDVRVRRFVSPEPTIYVGSEENIPLSPLSITFESPTPTKGSIIDWRNATIQANITDNSGLANSNVSSFIDFDRSISLYWSMDYYNSTGIFDNSSYFNNGSFTGIMSTNNISLGIRGNGLNFPGDNFSAGNYNSLKTANNLPAADNLTTDWTASAWINPTNYTHPDVGTVLILFNYVRITWTKSLNGQCSANIYNGSENPITTTCSHGNWTKIDFVLLNRNNISLYRNGVFISSRVISGNFGSGHNYTSIGGDDRYPQYEYLIFNGSIDEVKVEKRAKNAAEIKADYNSQINKFNADFSNLAGGWHNYTIYAINQTGFVNQSSQSFFVNTCVYHSGNWNIDCNSNCSITSAVNGDGSNLNIIGSGTFTTTKDIKGFKNVYVSGGSGKCNVNCYGGCFA